MRKHIVFALAGFLILSIGYSFGQRATATASITNEIAWFTIAGSRLSHTAGKRLTFVALHYNDATVPCIVVDTAAGALSNDTVGGAAISCGWNDKAIGVLSGVNN